MVSYLVKLVTQLILANNYNPLGKVGKTDNNKCKCLLILQLVVADIKDVNFLLFLPNKFALDSHITKYNHGRLQFSSRPLVAFCCYQNNETK